MISTDQHVQHLGALLLETGTRLMSCGANTNRIRLTLERMANAFECHAEVLITNRALLITLAHKALPHRFNGIKRTTLPGVNFKVLSGISRMSWSVVEDRWSLQQVEDELKRLVQLPHYNRWITLLVVSLAGASFCRIVGGEAPDMVITFIATFTGLFIRQELMKHKYNFYLCIFVASMVSALIAGLAVKLEFGEHPQHALATSVLYLIPGVPLINSLSDLIDGNIMNGVMRGVNGLIISFAIAGGLLVSFFIYNIQ